MVKMTCPITGTVLYVAEERVEKYKEAGYKPVIKAAPKKTAAKKTE